jgi:multidrug efflux system membrane fusion protein
MKRSGLIIGVIVVGLAAGGAWYLHSRTPEAARSARGGRGEGAAVAVVSAAAIQADFPVRKHAIGFVETPASVLVRSRIDSQIMAQHVTDGQFV